MTKYILHGGFTRERNKQNALFFKEITKDLIDEDNVLLVYFAREKDIWKEKFSKDKNFLLEQTDLKLNIVMANEESFEKQIETAKAIFFSGGGDIKKLIKILNSCSNFKDIIKEKILAGSSAGAYILSTYYHSASEGEIYKGLGILPIRIVCHYLSSKFNVTKEAITKIEKYPKNLELVVLKDYEYKIIEL